MIIKASQRGGAMQLAVHLLKPENEHVHVHEVRGFVAQDVPGAFKEAEVISAGTRARQHLFSVSLNPPPDEQVPIDHFESALDRIEASTGLVNHPRIVVFHEKEGRRHCHAVWSRIDAETMTAKHLPFYKRRMQEISHDLYLEHGWKMPRGLMRSEERDPRNFDLSEWQQAKRAGRDPRQLKQTIQECWAVSDNRASFTRALEERGLYLAKGDKRGHVAVTYEGYPFSIPRMLGCRVKDVRERLGHEKIEEDPFRSIDDTRKHIASVIAPKLNDLLEREKQRHEHQTARTDEERLSMRDFHSRERQRMAEGQCQRIEAENRQRAERIRGGLRGLLDHISGEYRRRREQNEREAYLAAQRDQQQRDAMVAAQLEERRALQMRIEAQRKAHLERTAELHRDLVLQQEQQERVDEQFNRIAAGQKQALDRLSQPNVGQMMDRLGKSPGHEPELGR